MKSCLVIDDSRVIRKVARRILEDIGFMVDEAEDGMAGLERCRSSMPEIIFVDSAMPNLDGVGFMKALRRETIGPVPKMILWTTENDESQIIQARAAGASEVMLKPFDKETIEGHLAAVGVFVRQ
jgi:two-component system chemotaxis response regulator CheY